MDPADSASRSSGHHVYRRVTPTSWDPRKNLAEPAAFKRRRNEASLSVFHAGRQTPRGVLQLCLDDQQRKLRSADPEEQARAANFLELYGTSVESLAESGWRVAVLPAAAFLERGFAMSPPDERGHQDVYGSYEDFARYSRELRMAARLLFHRNASPGEREYFPTQLSRSQPGV